MLEVAPFSSLASAGKNLRLRWRAAVQRRVSISITEGMKPHALRVIA
jgi:hypothetical protein